MLSRTTILLLAAALGSTAFLVAQEPALTWDPKDEPLPKLEDWLPRRRIDPGARVWAVAPRPATERACAIPLLPVRPRAQTRIRQGFPRDLGIIRHAEAPAPACVEWSFRKDSGAQEQPRP